MRRLSVFMISIMLILCIYAVAATETIVENQYDVNAGQPPAGDQSTPTNWAQWMNSGNLQANFENVPGDMKIEVYNQLTNPTSAMLKEIPRDQVTAENLDALKANNPNEFQTFLADPEVEFEPEGIIFTAAEAYINEVSASENGITDEKDKQILHKLLKKTSLNLPDDAGYIPDGAKLAGPLVTLGNFQIDMAAVDASKVHISGSGDALSIRFSGLSNEAAGLKWKGKDFTVTATNALSNNDVIFTDTTAGLDVRASGKGLQIATPDTDFPKIEVGYPPSMDILGAANMNFDGDGNLLHANGQGSKISVSQASGNEDRGLLLGYTAETEGIRPSDGSITIVREPNGVKTINLVNSGYILEGTYANDENVEKIQLLQYLSIEGSVRLDDRNDLFYRESNKDTVGLEIDNGQIKVAGRDFSGAQNSATTNRIIDSQGDKDVIVDNYKSLQGKDDDLYNAINTAVNGGDAAALEILLAERGITSMTIKRDFQDELVFDRKGAGSREIIYNNNGIELKTEYNNAGITSDEGTIITGSSIVLDSGDGKSVISIDQRTTSESMNADDFMEYNYVVYSADGYVRMFRNIGYENGVPHTEEECHDMYDDLDRSDYVPADYVKASFYTAGDEIDSPYYRDITMSAGSDGQGTSISMLVNQNSVPTSISINSNLESFNAPQLFIDSFMRTLSGNADYNMYSLSDPEARDVIADIMIADLGLDSALKDSVVSYLAALGEGMTNPATMGNYGESIPFGGSVIVDVAPEAPENPPGPGEVPEAAEPDLNQQFQEANEAYLAAQESGADQAVIDAARQNLNRINAQIALKTLEDNGGNYEIEPGDTLGVIVGNQLRNELYANEEFREPTQEEIDARIALVVEANDNVPDPDSITAGESIILNVNTASADVLPEALPLPVEGGNSDVLPDVLPLPVENGNGGVPVVAVLEDNSNDAVVEGNNDVAPVIADGNGAVAEDNNNVPPVIVENNDPNVLSIMALIDERENADNPIDAYTAFENRQDFWNNYLFNYPYSYLDSNLPSNP